MYVAGVPLTVNPVEHVALTVHELPPTTAPQFVTSYVAPFAFVIASALVHSHTGAVPLHVPATWHVYVAGVPLTVYPVLHVALTVHVPPTTIAFIPHAVVVTDAEFATVNVNALVHSHTGAVPLNVPAT